MRLAKFWPGLLTTLFLISAIPVAAQLPSAQPSDPLARIRAAAQGNTQACSATGETLCEQVAPKIIENAMGDSPLAENLRRLTKEVGGRLSGTSATGRAVAWSVATFRDAGVDVHTEKYAKRIGGPADQENVVAEIRGREKPEECVLLGAHLDSGELADGGLNASVVIEAARDILRTGIRPRRSMRFVLFTGEARTMPGSWAYVRAHRAELDRIRAAIFFSVGAGHVTGFRLNGRHDLEIGLREAMKPIESLGADHHVFDAPIRNESFDFLLEGVPSVIAIRETAKHVADPRVASDRLDNVDVQELKRNAAITAVTAFGIAEREAPLGPRQSRAEIESLLKTSGLDKQMKIMGLWPLWESGERGRLP